MRLDQIALNGDFLLQVPQRLADDHPLSHLEGESFEVTVVETGQRLNGQAAVTVERMLWTYMVSIELLAEQKRTLGLPTDSRYVVEGSVLDDNGRPITQPVPERLTVPARWLRATQ